MPLIYSFGISSYRREIKNDFGKICAKIHLVLLKKEANIYYGKGWENRTPYTDVALAQKST